MESYERMHIFITPIHPFQLNSRYSRSIADCYRQDFQRLEMQTLFASMYDQLQKALRSDGLASRQKLRGRDPGSWWFPADFGKGDNSSAPAGFLGTWDIMGSVILMSSPWAASHGPGELVLLDPDHRVKPQRSKYWVFYEGASLGDRRVGNWTEKYQRKWAFCDM